MLLPPNLMPQPQDKATTLAAWRFALQTAPYEVAEVLAVEFSPARLKARRHAERNACLVRMALGQGDCGVDIAKRVHLQIRRYASTAWRFDQDRHHPHDARHALVHRILHLSEGKVLSERSLRRIFSPVAKKSTGNGQDRDA